MIINLQDWRKKKFLTHRMESATVLPNRKQSEIMKQGDKVQKKLEWISHKARHPWKPPEKRDVGTLLHNVDAGTTWLVQWPWGEEWEHEDNLEIILTRRKTDEKE